MSRSGLVQALCLVAAIAISVNFAHGDNLNVAPANLKTTSTPIIIKTTPGASLGLATSPANVVVHSVTTIKPAPQNNAALKEEVKVVPQVTVVPAAAEPASLQLSTVKPLIVAVASGPTTVVPTLSSSDRVSQYFEPICGQLDKLQPKQMFKIQSQLKQFVERTAGKMSICFMQTYSMDPNLTPVNKAQLQTICSSKNLDLGAKGSFKSFLDCAGRHYDPTLDAELARIQKSRANLGVNHDHSKDNLASLPHDDDELSLISEVVNKVIADSKNLPEAADIKILDLNAPKRSPATVHIVLKTTTIPVIEVSRPTTATPVFKLATVTQAPSLADKLKPSSTPAKNTTVIIVDNTVSNVTTKSPQKGEVVVVSQTTVAPKQVVATTLIPVKLVTTTSVPKQATPASTAKPVEVKLVVTTPAPEKSTGLGEKIVAAVGSKTTATPSKTVIVITEPPKATSTAAPTAADSKTTTAEVIKITVTSTTGKPSEGTTKKPEGGSTAAPKASAAPTAASANAGKTTEKPIKEVVSVVKKQEKEKETDKKEEDVDAKNAIKSLQAHRAQAHGSPADVRMHQIEHERQMSIDPIGHTIKHQEYEKKKAATSAAKAASTTKKPQ